MEDIKDIAEEDIDVLNEDIQSHFKTPYSLKEFKSVGLDDTYVLHLSTNSDCILAGLSNNSLVAYDNSNLNKVQTFDFESPLIDVKCNQSDNNLFYTGTSKEIQIWDLRTKSSPVQEFNLNENNANGHKPKPFTTFDVNKDNRYITAGTEVVNHDAFVLFWDARSGTKFLGGYWETFGEDLTVTKFAPNDANQLVTASSDGQVNLFDISQESEDDALVTSLNTEAVIRSVTFLSDNKLAIIQDHEEALLWKTEDSEAYKTFTREDFTSAIKRKVTPWTYIGGCHHDPNSGKTYFLAGSSYESNPCLRVLNLSKTKLKPMADLSSAKAKNTTIRSSCLAQNGTTFISGSEDGLICLWSNEEQSNENDDNKTSNKLKAMKKLKISKKPYDIK